MWKMNVFPIGVVEIDRLRSRRVTLGELPIKTEIPRSLMLQRSVGEGNRARCA
jgi:hypothetical protein